MKLVTQLSIVFLCLVGQISNAQDSISIVSKAQKIEILKQEKQAVEAEERELLKKDIEAIEARLKNGEITKEESDRLKLEAAKVRAANIDNKKAIIDNKIALIERDTNTIVVDTPDEDRKAKVTVSMDESNSIRPAKTTYRVRRTYSGLVFAAGFNNALIEGQDIDNSPYKIGGSGFFELGVALNTPITQSSNFLTLKYGLSFQWNKYNIKDNQYFVEDQLTNLVTLQEHPDRLNEAKFRVTNMVVPVHLEFGSSRRMVTKNGMTFSRGGSFKLGLGGYAGLRLSTVQKLKFDESTEFRGKKQKIKDDYNTSNFVYGLSAYIGFDEFSLYAKYDLSPLFKDQPIQQNNISVGLRIDFD